MESHPEINDEIRDMVAEYAFGSMPEEERESLRLHLRNCESCQREASEILEVVSKLLEASPLIEPPASLKDRVMTRIRTSKHQEPRPSSLHWRPMGPVGVKVSVLSKDLSTQRATILIEMEPGSALPRHHHKDTEECYVVRGTVRDDSSELEAGEFVRFEAGSTHGPVRTDTGCTLLLAVHSDEA